ncbi:MAG: class I SAM-dependent methyltransferase [Nitrososphaerales archaeon]
MNEQFDPVKYKEDLRKDWDEKIEIYYERYVSKRIGPFKSVEKLIEGTSLLERDRVLDVATGTGVVALEALKKVGSNGRVVGIDISTGALAIARKLSSNFRNLEFLEMDAEDLKFPDRSFDVVTSEFALMFFPNVQKALKEIKRVLVENGRIAVSVHGSAENAPFFSVITSSILDYIPHIVPAGRPSPHRFGDPEILSNEFAMAGFKNIHVESYTYAYNAGTFEDYWQDYMESTAFSLRAKMEELDPESHEKIKAESREKAKRFLKDDMIVFPWQVLIASAKS